MTNYSIISFNFSDYDIMRNIQNNGDVDCVYISDHFEASKCWKVIVDEKLANKNPIYSSYYVRYHAFEYVKTEIVVIIDSSIRINESINDIVKDFVESGSDLSVMCTEYYNDEDKIKYWKDVRRYNHQDNIDAALGFINKCNRTNERGSIGSAFIIAKKTQKTLHFFQTVWDTLISLGSYGIPNRFDEVIAHKLLPNFGLKLFYLSTQIIQSSYMSYCNHKDDRKISPGRNYDQYYYVNGRPIKPLRYDHNIRFPTEYKYNTEAILLTKYLNEDDLIEWINWHLNICKFDQIHVFDNDSNYDVESICQLYSNKVSYEKVSGVVRQYKLYNEYIQQSKAQWIMPIDDDEYLLISPEFNSVYDAVKYYEAKFPHMNMLGVRWKHLFPEKFHSERTGKVLDYCTKSNADIARLFSPLGDSGIKTIVKNYGSIYYEETVENTSGGHVPKNSTFYGAVMCDGNYVKGCGIPICPETLPDERIRLLHCRYKGYSEYTRKMKEVVTVSDATPRKKHFKFDDILETLD